MKRSKEQLAAIHAKIKKLKEGTVKAYDVKLKRMETMENPIERELKNGRYALQGKSKGSGIMLTRIVG